MGVGGWSCALASLTLLVGCGGSESDDLGSGGRAGSAGAGGGSGASGGIGGSGAAGGSAGTGGSGGAAASGGSGGATGGTAGSGGSAGVGGSAGSAGGVRFAAIGDYGTAGDILQSLIDGEPEVAALVKSWNPEFVITLGDNNYPDGAASTIDANIGQFYASFIGNYRGAHGPGAASNRFWPSPGNHDWNTPTLQPYLDYFTLPNNERYYDVDLGLVHLYALDSDPDEPDGTSASSVQAQWLQARLQASTSCYDLVYFHHPPYNSGSHHGSSTNMRWPFKEWGADAVLAGHEHVYERLEVAGMPYFVNGLGGALAYQFGTPLPESKFRYAAGYGAMLISATPSGITFEFHAVNGGRQDSLTVPKSCN